MGPIHGVPADFALSAAVALVPAIVGDEGTMARLAFDHFDGLVLASYGCGNTPPRLAEAAYAWVEAGKPVVLASRCAAGEVTPAYGFEGGSATAVRHGVTLAGARTAAQARMELAIALSAGLRYDA
jgi:L-asparaginase